VTTTIDRAEINRRNSMRSTGPRTPEGKARSRFNAVKHGCRARLPILPGEDPAVYQDRLDTWVDKFAPRDAVEHYLVERVVHVSWQLDRANRAEVARLAAELAEEDAKLAENAAELGAILFRAPKGRIAGHADSGGEADSSSLSWPSDPEHSRHPARLVAVLETSAIGCDWLRRQWAALGQVLDEGRWWRPIDRLRAIRLLGKQPRDAAADPRVLAIYLACRAMDPEGPDVFAEALGEPDGPEAAAGRERLAARCAAAGAERGPQEAAGARAELRALAAAGAARAEALGEVRRSEQAAETADIAGRLSYDSERALEWVRKNQVTCSRSLYRAIEELRKLRRDFGAAQAADEPAAGPVASGPGADAAQASEPSEAPRAPVVPASDPCAVTLAAEAHATREAEESPAPRRCEVVATDDPPPTGSAPVAVEPVDQRDAPIVTNEASGPAPTVTNEASGPPASSASEPVGIGSSNPALRPTDGCPGSEVDGPKTDTDARTVTNEASGPTGDAPVVADETNAPAARPAPDGTNEAKRPTEAAARAVTGLLATALALLALLGSASFGAMGAGVGPNPTLQMHRDAPKSKLMGTHSRVRAPSGGAADVGLTEWRAEPQMNTDEDRLRYCDPVAGGRPPGHTDLCLSVFICGSIRLPSPPGGPTV
jgi:hypothetical protein